MRPILEIASVSKSFRIRHEMQAYLSMRESIMGLLRRRNSTSEIFFALKDVSFNVQPGDSIGIIGKNGAGKSTLLKILSRITPPSSGKISVRGRIASLLEVGTGFHPELSGRENIYLNGSVLGMKRKEIDRRFDEIVDFSGTEKFLDTPLKHFSSGMQLRLAFSVAAFLEPEILVIDEVLAVGDAEFQKKCLGKMEDVSKSGRTILFVSHDLQAVSTLTQRCVLLEQGKVALDGNTPAVIEKYLHSREMHSGAFSAPPREKRPTITRIEVKTSEASQVQINGKPMCIEFDVHMPEAQEGIALSFQIINYREQPIVHLWIFDTQQKICRTPGTHTLRCEIPELKLYMGNYHVRAFLGDSRSKVNYEEIDFACPFRVEMFGIYRDYEWVEGTCAYLEQAQWITENVKA